MQFLKKKKTLLVLVDIQKQQKYNFKEQCLLIEFYIELNNFIYLSNLDFYVVIKSKICLIMRIKSVNNCMILLFKVNSQANLLTQTDKQNEMGFKDDQSWMVFTLKVMYIKLL